MATVTALEEIALDLPESQDYLNLLAAVLARYHPEVAAGAPGVATLCARRSNGATTDERSTPFLIGYCGDAIVGLLDREWAD